MVIQFHVYITCRIKFEGMLMCAIFALLAVSLPVLRKNTTGDVNFKSQASSSLSGWRIMEMSLCTKNESGGGGGG